MKLKAYNIFRSALKVKFLLTFKTLKSRLINWVRFCWCG